MDAHTHRKAHSSLWKFAEKMEGWGKDFLQMPSHEDKNRHRSLKCSSNTLPLTLYSFDFFPNTLNE